MLNKNIVHKIILEYSFILLFLNIWNKLSLQINLLASSQNKRIEDDTKAAAHQSLNCIKNEKK